MGLPIGSMRPPLPASLQIVTIRPEKAGRFIETRRFQDRSFLTSCKELYEIIDRVGNMVRESQGAQIVLFLARLLLAMLALMVVLALTFLPVLAIEFGMLLYLESWILIVVCLFFMPVIIRCVFLLTIAVILLPIEASSKESILWKPLLFLILGWIPPLVRWCANPSWSRPVSYGSKSDIAFLKALIVLGEQFPDDTINRDILRTLFTEAPLTLRLIKDTSSKMVSKHAKMLSGKDKDWLSRIIALHFIIMLIARVPSRFKERSSERENSRYCFGGDPDKLLKNFFLSLNKGKEDFSAYGAYIINDALLMQLFNYKKCSWRGTVYISNKQKSLKFCIDRVFSQYGCELDSATQNSKGEYELTLPTDIWILIFRLAGCLLDNKKSNNLLDNKKSNNLLDNKKSNKKLSQSPDSAWKQALDAAFMVFWFFFIPWAMPIRWPKYDFAYD